MRRLLLGALGVLLLNAGLVPPEAAAQCTYCVQCTIDPRRAKFDDYNPSNFYVAGNDGDWNCGPNDEADCSHFFGCPGGEAESEETPIYESELLALVSSGAATGLRDFIEAHRDRIELVLERDLILTKERTACGERIVGVYEVSGLRAVLSQ